MSRELLVATAHRCTVQVTAAGTDETVLVPGSVISSHTGQEKEMLDPETGVVSFFMKCTSQTEQ